MVHVGLIVNPIAGMGGKVGLKGTDGEMYERALKLGAEPVASARIEEVLSLVKRKDLFFYAAPREMGEDYLEDFDFEVVGEIGEKTGPEDTKRLVGDMIKKGIKVLIFVGGDGTARDVLDVVGLEVPVIAIPSGVKMFSSAFAFSSHAAAELINSFGEDFIEKEILDIDEKAFRGNILDSKAYGKVRVPNIQFLLQKKKAASNIKFDVKVKKQEVAKYLVENMEEDCVYILGPGTTVKEITDAIGVEKTLLGIDAIYNKKLIGLDLIEKDLLGLIDQYQKVKIIVTPIGGSGFIFGRGSKQISTDVLKHIGKENIIVVSTLDKVGGLENLYIDSGDYEVDKLISGNINVLIGYDEELIMEVKC